MVLLFIWLKNGFELVRYNDLRDGLTAFFFSFLIIVLLAGIICTFNTVKGATRLLLVDSHFFQFFSSNLSRDTPPLITLAYF